MGVKATSTEISSVTLFLFFLILFYLFFFYSFISFLKVENGFYSSKPRLLGDPSSRDLQVNELLGRKILRFSFRRFLGCSELKSRVQGTTLAGGNTRFGVRDHDGQMRGEAPCILNRRACCGEAVLRRDGVRARCRSPFPRRLALFRRKTRRSLRAAQRESGDEKRRQIAVPIGADHAQDVAHDAATGKEESPQ